MTRDAVSRIYWIAALIMTLSVWAVLAAGGGAEGSIPYESFSPDTECAECHVAFARQHEQSMMSQSYTHHWDEIEYFKLALPHSLKEPKVAGIKAGCNGCHAPLAFLAGDIPPKPVKDGTRANEGVSCDLCHSITGFTGDVPFNFNYVIEAGDREFGARPGIESPGHEIGVSPFFRTAEFCGICHNEKDPWDQWVKATHLEWKEGPYGGAGIVCQECHMPPAAGASSIMSDPRPDTRQHLFHGAHDAGKLMGAAEVRIHPEARTVKAGSTQTLTAVVVNAKAGHRIPTGSAEERVVWLHVEAMDGDGDLYHLPVDRKGFEGEDFTVASSKALAYQDLGEIQGIPDFKGLPRDGMVPDGDRIFRLPYLDPKGRMTVAQWNTASFGPDYRLPPLEAITETFTWQLPANVQPGEVRVTAQLWYSRLVSSVAKHLGVPDEEWAPVLMGEHITTFEVK